MSSKKRRRSKEEKEEEFLRNIAKLPLEKQQEILAKRATKRPKRSKTSGKSIFKLQRDARDEISFQNIQYVIENGLRHVVPYTHRYETNCKRRWIGQQILTMFSTEFRHSCPASYYSQAIARGLIRVNNAPVNKDYVLKDGDVVLHISHRHEPPVSDQTPVVIDTTEDYVVISKPAGLVCHPSGAYAANSLTRIMQRDLSVGPLFICHRLDRLTSGLMLIARSNEAASSFCEMMKAGSMKKEYLARVQRIDLSAAQVPRMGYVDKITRREFLSTKVEIRCTHSHGQSNLGVHVLCIRRTCGIHNFSSVG